MLGSKFDGYLEMVRDQIKSLIQRVEKKPANGGLSSYEVYGTQKELMKLKALDEKLQVLYKELEFQIESNSKIKLITDEINTILNEADVYSSMIEPSLYKAVVKVGKDKVENEIYRSIFKTIDPETKEAVKIELRKTVRRGDDILLKQIDETEIKKEFIAEMRRRIGE
jgi:RNA-binding protein YhbY